MATWVWPRKNDAVSDDASTAAQNRWIRNVSSRSGLASPPFGVTTNRQGSRSTAAPSDFR